MNVGPSVRLAFTCQCSTAFEPDKKIVLVAFTRPMSVTKSKYDTLWAYLLKPSGRHHDVDHRLLLTKSTWVESCPRPLDQAPFSSSPSLPQAMRPTTPTPEESRWSSNPRIATSSAYRPSYAYTPTSMCWTGLGCPSSSTVVPDSARSPWGATYGLIVHSSCRSSRHAN